MSSRYKGGFLSLSYDPFLVPNAPTIGTATGGNASASVTFTAPSNVGGGAITSYVVLSSGGQTASGASSPITVTGLTNGSTYTFVVFAVNAYGMGPASAISNSVIPDAPQLWSFGVDTNGQLGIGTSGFNKSSPVQVGALTNWSSVATGGTAFSVAVKTDGTLWSWGNNYKGQLGLGIYGSGTYYSSPKQIGALTNWIYSACGDTFAAAIKTDGTLWTWGNNLYGQLGLNSSGAYQTKASPNQVGALTNWSSISCGFANMLAVKTDGTLWSWGRNNNGQLGNSNTSNYSSPIQIGALTTWLKVVSGSYHSLAIKTDGTLWSWGNNGIGNLGLGNTTYYSSPKQIGALTTWTINNITKTLGSSSLALKSDGTLWSWGYNAQGQLGLGNATNYSSPKQVGLLTDWLRVSGGPYHTLAVKTGGTLWSWGYGPGGALGLGNETSYSSPKQVGALTTWTKVSAGGNFSMAIKSA